jgi:hypothetical protein
MERYPLAVPRALAYYRIGDVSVPPVEKAIAAQIARQYVSQLEAEAGVPMSICSKDTIQCDFGWVFFYAPKDSQELVAGNAPIIVDREDGAVHLTGTAYPIEHYLESYARVRRPYPFAVEEHVVVLYGWKPGLLKISMVKAIRAATGQGLAEAKACVDEVVGGRSVSLSCSSASAADDFRTKVQVLGVLARRETRYR